jgi:hypothetical protein
MLSAGLLGTNRNTRGEEEVRDEENIRMSKHVFYVPSL